MARRSDAWKARRAKYLPERMRNAREKITALGYQIIGESDTELRFLFHCQIVRFSPYTGWATGKSIQDGRGLDNLLAQITPKR